MVKSQCQPFQGNFSPGTQWAFSIVQMTFFFFFLKIHEHFYEHIIKYLPGRIALDFFRGSNYTYIESPLSVFQIYHFLIKTKLSLLLFYNVYFSHYYSLYFWVHFQSI